MGNPRPTEVPMESTALIVRTPGTCGGKPRIAGHRIRVQDVVIWHHRMKMSINEILDEFPGPNPEKVAAAPDYYGAHREEIDGLIQDEDDFAGAFRRDHVSVLDRFREVPGRTD